MQALDSGPQAELSPDQHSFFFGAGAWDARWLFFTFHKRLSLRLSDVGAGPFGPFKRRGIVVRRFLFLLLCGLEVSGCGPSLAPLVSNVTDPTEPKDDI